jgi:Transmembrane secretion effector
MGRSLAVFWPEPDLAPELEPQGGAVLVQTVYSITAERETESFEAMALGRRSRMRTGATEWGLFRDGARPQRIVEVFIPGPAICRPADLPDRGHYNGGWRFVLAMHPPTHHQRRCMPQPCVSRIEGGG